MPPSSRAVNRLRELYRSVLMHMRELNARQFNPPRTVVAFCRPCGVEPLEPRLLLSGTSYVVNSLMDVVADDGVVTLREAIEAANTNTAVTADVIAGSGTEMDLITFDQAALSAEAGVAVGAPLTITLDGTQLEIADDLEISGLGQDLLTLDADGRSRVFTMAYSQAEIILSGLTIVGGTAPSSGGGIYNDCGTLTLTNVTVSGNSASPSSSSYCSLGGGIYNESGTLTLTNVTVSGNSASSSSRSLGGGIYNNSGTLTLTNVTVSGNSASCPDGSSGGGIYNDTGTLTLTNVTVSGNSSSSSSYSSYYSCSSSGGGIYNVFGTLTLTNVTVSGNSASSSSYSFGGGIYNDCGTLTLTNVTVSGNSAFSSFYSYGGGIYNDAGTLTLTNVMVSGNSASSCYSFGGGIYNSSGTLALTNVTVSGNSASSSSSSSFYSYGGGIYSAFSTLTLNNSIVAMNEAGSVAELQGSFAGSHNLIGVDPGFVRSPSAGADGVWGTADDDRGDLRLGDTSIAINLGDSALAVDAQGQPLTVDLGGSARITDGVVDLGAYEYQQAISREPVSTVVTTLSHVVDGTDGDVSLPEAVFYATLVHAAVTFDPLLAGGTIVLNGRELELYQSVEVDGTGVGGITIDGDGRSRVFSVCGSQTAVGLFGLTITGGSASPYGGGICNNSGTLTLTNVTVRGNSASSSSYSFGGGIYNDCGTLTLTNVTVSGNSASSDWSSGGGIYNDCGTLTLTNVKVSGNSASSSSHSSGGGIYNESGTLTLTNVTVSGNSACSSSYDSSGGGICNAFGTLMLNNSIVAMNEAGSMAELQGSFAGSHNLIGVDPGFVRSPSAGADGVWGTADDDAGDLRLLQDGAAVDGGDNVLLPADASDLDGDGTMAEPLPVDLAGQVRVYGATVDIGAYEYQPATATVVGRRVFYNGSGLDGNDPAANGADDAAVAAHLEALRPGQASGGHHTSGYAKGLNGVMIDIACAGGAPTTADFAVRVGGTPGGDGWSEGPAPSVSVRAGADGTSRVTLIWPDGAIQNGWLEVTVKATARTALAESDVFYFGHLAGDADGDGRVTLSDLAILATHWNGPGTPSDGDFSGDGQVGQEDLDTLATRWNLSLPVPVGTPVEVAVPPAVTADTGPDPAPRTASRLATPARRTPARAAVAKDHLAGPPAQRPRPSRRANLLDEPVVDLLATM